MSSFYNNRLSLSIFGQSHGECVGMTLDGLPAGEVVDMNELQNFLDRRAPGRNAWSTTRKEADAPEFLSGIVDGYTCGAPLTAIIRNSNTRSKDYSNLKITPRPGHADYVAEVKYSGFQDVAGGGHFSGRVTAALCIAGGIAKQILSRYGIRVYAHLLSVGEVTERNFNPLGESDEVVNRVLTAEFPTIDEPFGIKMREAIEKARLDNDSLGGIIECMADGLPTGLGEPMFEGMENRIARLVFAVPAVKGVEFGAGFGVAKLKGSENNDDFTVTDGKITTVTNNHGGILGGITSGMPLIMRAAIKPTPSISKPQQSVNLEKDEPQTLVIEGRHDPCIAPRAVPCIESAVALAILDALYERY